jgi:hypothetical protein
VPSYPQANPALDDALSALLGSAPGTRLEPALALSRSWREVPDSIAFAPRYEVVDDEFGARISVRLDDHRLHLDEPLLLGPVQVPKPWGQEIWFTGIEARGESAVVTAAGRLPLSQYLALAPRHLCRDLPLVLLKVLDPKPEPVLGDLYFEVHEHKQEVYVVTGVDPQVWPSGAGRIRFGMNQALRARYADDAAFRRDYLRAVQAYEQARRAIDGGQSLPSGRETALRAAMEAFTAVRELAVGDVVAVPTWLPHALQHGVRVVEFQTPTYERYIISFAQRVLTQDYWDSAAAVQRMSLEPPPRPIFESLGPGVERIVAFDDFKVWRVQLAPGAAHPLPSHPSYVLCMTVQGCVGIGPLIVDAEQAAFVPGAALAHAGRRNRCRIVNRGETPASVLLAAPDL